MAFVPPPQLLGDLVAQTPGAELIHGEARTRIFGVSNDTRLLEPGELFVAVPGLERDGLDFVPRALGNGAVAIAAQHASQVIAGTVPLVRVDNARRAVGDLSAAFYGHPSRALPVVGVTGTDGKTSTTHLLSAILEAHGLRTGWLTTVNTKIGDELRPNTAEHTTPEAPLVQRTLAEMLDAQLDVAILETSSHALELDRVRGVAYRVGVFTNLSPEHINFHGSFEAYRLAKRRLFESLPPDGLAVLNADDTSSEVMREATIARVLTYALDTDADITASDIELSPSGTAFTVTCAPHAVIFASDLTSSPLRQRASEAMRSSAPAGRLHSRLVGRFNVANWLAACAAATFFWATLDDLRQAVATQGPVPGRMNLVDAGQPFAVVVDFAHTPQALEKALDTVRSLVPGKVLLAFGLAGGRDFANRPVMGRLASEKSDFFVITTDDPYDEDPAEIARQIASGTTEGNFAIEPDRHNAIDFLVARAQPGDAVLLAGKGHEQRMMAHGQRLPWNDARAAHEVLAARGFRTQAVP
jgi:UDP-N-acetylmuramoyl-L-alanyl-D-glutamate--2,6-diaminopimelate ligase